jgi:hypothetical protein
MVSCPKAGGRSRAVAGKERERRPGIAAPRKSVESAAMPPSAITRVDPHLHAGASACSSLTDEQALSWFEENPDYAVVVSDHMTWRFYELPRARLLLERALFAVEITIEGLYDFLLLTSELAAFDRLLPEASPSQLTYRKPPLGVLADPRVLVVFAHPPQPGALGRSWPRWMNGLPVDFLEFNAARYDGVARASALRRRRSADQAMEELHNRLQDLREKHFDQARFLVGSDSHGPDRLGTTYAALHTPAANGAEVWRALLDGRFTGYLGVPGEGTWTIDPVKGLLGRTGDLG